MATSSGLHITLASERLLTVAGLPITNAMLTMWLVMLTLFVLALIVRRNVNIIPGKVQNIAEMGYELVYGYMMQTLGDKRMVDRYLPLIASIFFFMLFSNVFDLLPIFGTFTFANGEGTVPLFHEVNADLNTPLAFAIISFLVVELSGIFTLGVL
ncbi:MAG TPA: F0F1 ATP synthase subunit A, partial [Candidatus Paceibacterota bacterium]|nr:F0F1 ATP synthase subunit A [Candidatus Paceibacterota bacterium]